MRPSIVSLPLPSRRARAEAAGADADADAAPRRGRRWRRTAVATIAAVIGSGVVAASPGVANAVPDWPGPSPHPATATADALPTVQVDGVIWSLAIVGNTVYAGGNFTTTWPAGSTQEAGPLTPRSNFLAFDLATGALRTDIDLPANAQVRTVTASPDGSRLYVGGDFTSFGGVARNRIAVVDTSSNALTAFSANVGYHVHSISVTGSTVYVGGNFQNVGVNTRMRLAAFNVNGGLLPWAPTADDLQVDAMQVSPDGTKVAIGGRFNSVNGIVGTGAGGWGRGLVVVDAVTGAILPFAATSIIRNGGGAGGITTLTSDGAYLYGGGFTFGRDAGTLEGVFAAAWADGAVRWIDDCHGDTYGVAQQGGLVYQVGHSHYCGNMGSFGQPTTNSTTWPFRRAIALTKEPQGVIATERLGYSNFAGQPRPDITNFFPTISPGTFTGAGQGAWSVATNSRYVVLGGEFPAVNGTTQRGLVRFQTREYAANSQGPTLFNASYPIKVQSFAGGTATISWQANTDRDDATLEYRVYRRPTGSTANGTLLHSRTVSAPWWNLPVMNWTDATATPGASFQYRVQVTDGWGNFANSPWTELAAPGTGSASSYLSAVLASEADSYWRLGESAGATTAVDLLGFRDATPSSGVTFGQAGAIGGDADTGALLSGGSNVFLRSSVFEQPTDTVSLEAWIKTPTTATGGLIVGFNNTSTGAGSTSLHDRALYMDTSGRLSFAVNPTTPVAVQTEKDFRDNEWHHVVGTIGADGMRLYVDGRLYSGRTDVTTGRTGYFGYWRIGGGAINGLPNAGTTDAARFFDGQIDDVAMYKRVLTPTEVVGHYGASGRVVQPSDAYGSTVVADGPYLYWRLDETTGTSALDTSLAGRNGTFAGSGYSLGTLPGALSGSTRPAVAFNGTNGRISRTNSVAAPTDFSEELWFRTTATTVGKLIGFGNQTGTNASTSFDRHLYTQANGQVVFGTSAAGTSDATSLQTANQFRITSPASYNDGQWHHVVATRSSTSGMRLYVDGNLVGQNTAATSIRSYNGYWRVGGDTTWATANGSVANAFFNGAIDEVAVYPYELDAATVARHHAAGAVAPNQPPTAAIQVTSQTDLTVTVSGTGSVDPDGTITATSWNFGDSTPAATTATATHTYANAGTYTITLTVTDDRGATSTTSTTVTVVAPNQPPTAAIQVTSQTDLTVTVSGTGSVDPDGTITATSWNFGDSTPAATTATATHTYANAGTYTITLTVTDDRGATSTTSTTVTVSSPAAPGTVAADTFSRTVAASLGTADFGGAWTLSTAGSGSVADGVGRITGAVATNRAAYLTGATSADVDVVVDLAVDQASNGGGVYASVIGRRVSNGNDYRAKLRYLTNGQVQVSLTRTVGGTETVFTTATVPGLTVQAGQSLTVRFQVAGTATTTLGATVWRTGSAEPTTNLVTFTDTAPAVLQAPGHVGLLLYTSGSWVGAAPTILVDNLAATLP